MIMADLCLFFLVAAMALLTISHGLHAPSILGQDFRCIFHLSDVKRSDQQLIIRDLKPKILSCEALDSTVLDFELTSTTPSSTTPTSTTPTSTTPSSTTPTSTTPTSTTPTSIKNLNIYDRVRNCSFLQVGQTCIEKRIVVYMNFNVTQLTASITWRNLTQSEQINITILLSENDSVCESPVVNLSALVNQSDTCDGNGLVHCEILESPNTTKNLSNPLIIRDMAVIRCSKISHVPVFFSLDNVVQNRDSVFTDQSQLILTRTHLIFVLYFQAGRGNPIFRIASGNDFPHRCLAKVTLINPLNSTNCKMSTSPTSPSSSKDTSLDVALLTLVLVSILLCSTASPS